MSSKIPGGDPSPLAQILPDAQFSEAHHGIIPGTPEAAWAAVHAMRWSDLALARRLMGVRGFGMPIARDTIYETFTSRAGGVLQERPPASSLLVMIGKPWSPVPQRAQVESIDDVMAFAEPGWLKYGMEWLFHGLGDGRTLVETRTLCQATDATARRAFSAYWALIRIPSGLIRREMIAALGRAVIRP